jgi:hypothetical protein
MMNDALKQFLNDNPVEDMPFYPGARCTGRVGFRSSREVLEAGASPIHLGVDRAGGDGLVMPFEGWLHWEMVGGVAGSVLRLTPLHDEFQIQVFHTEADHGVTTIDRLMHRGEPLPVKPSDLGLSVGVHTHTELMFECKNDNVLWATAGQHKIVDGRWLNSHEARAHAEANDLIAEDFVISCRTQIGRWFITDLWEHAAIRSHVPQYRKPPWGGPTLFVDSLWALQI